MMSRPVLRRRLFLAGMLACGVGPTRVARAEARRFRIALANLDETPGVTLEGLGFTGSDVRRSFELAARTLPVDMLYFDNAGDSGRAVANAEAAIAAKVDLLIEYNADAEANAEIARRLAAAAIPALALVDPLPGASPGALSVLSREKPGRTSRYSGCSSVTSPTRAPPSAIAYRASPKGYTSRCPR